MFNVYCSQYPHDVSQVVNDECGHLRTFSYLHVPTVEKHGVNASLKGTKNVGLQVVAYHQRCFATGSGHNRNTAAKAC